MPTKWTRRSMLAGAAAAGSALIVRPTLAADYKFSQYLGSKCWSLVEAEVGRLD